MVNFFSIENYNSIYVKKKITSVGMFYLSGQDYGICSLPCLCLVHYQDNLGLIYSFSLPIFWKSARTLGLPLIIWFPLSPLFGSFFIWQIISSMSSMTLCYHPLLFSVLSRECWHHNPAVHFSITGWFFVTEESKIGLLTRKLHIIHDLLSDTETWYKTF